MRGKMVGDRQGCKCGKNLKKAVEKVILLFNHMEKKARLKLPKVLSDIHYFFLPFFSNPFREDKAANTCYRDLWNDGTGGIRWKRKKIIGGIQEKRCRMIGIAGSNVGVGCTHFSVMLTNYLAGLSQKKSHIAGI